MIGPAICLEQQRGNLLPSVRHGVSIDRHTGSAADQRLYQHRVAVPAGDPVLRAELSFSRMPLAEELADLRLAASLVQGLGSGLARGLGQVALELLEESEPVRPRPSVLDRKAASLVLRLTPLTPFHIGIGRSRPFFLPCNDHVPGGAVRGAVGTALAALGFEAEPGFRKICGLDGHSGALFGDAVPFLDGSHPVQPRTRLRCRACRWTASHLVNSLAAIERGASSVRSLFAQHGRCPKCGERTQAVEPYEVLPRRLWTRVSLDRHTASAADQQLHAMEVVDLWEHSSVRMRSEIRGLDDESRGLLARLHEREILVGHGRGVGLGRMRVSLEQSPVLPDAVKRSRKLHDAVAAQCKGAPAPSISWVVLLLTGPWTRACGGEHPMQGRQGVELLRCHPVRGVVSGFDVVVGRERQRHHAWMPGTVFVYRVAEKPTAAWLQHLQEEGLAGHGPGAVRGEGRFEVNPEVCWQEEKS